MKREAYERAEEENLFEPEDEEDEEDDDSEVEESAELENLWFGVKEAV